jgi:hypothetical protein
MHRVSFGLIITLAVFSFGCANSTHMFLVQQTQLGLAGSVNPQNNSAKIVIGYHRTIATVIPKVDRSPDATAADSTNMDAGSVLVASRASFRYLHIPELDEFVATGGAANNLGSTEAAKNMFTGIHGPGDRTDQTVIDSNPGASLAPKNTNTKPTPKPSPSASPSDNP